VDGRTDRQMECEAILDTTCHLTSVTVVTDKRKKNSICAFFIFCVVLFFCLYNWIFYFVLVCTSAWNFMVCKSYACLFLINSSYETCSGLAVYSLFDSIFDLLELYSFPR
jgi:hypothetical protein